MLLDRALYLPKTWTAAEPMSQGVPAPEDGESLTAWLPDLFFEEAAKRGVAPGVLARRIVELSFVLEREGAELFADWADWPREESRRWCRVGVTERVRLEFPYLDEDAG